MNNLCKKSKATKTIHGEDVNFYAIPMGTVFKFKHLSKNASSFFAILFADKSKDVATESYTGPSDQKDEKGDAYTQTQNTTKEISASLASLRAKQITESINGLVEALFAEDAQELLAEIIVKSASDNFTEDDAKTLFDNMDSGSVAQYLFGAFEASKEGFEGLGKSLSLLGNFEKLKEVVVEGGAALKEAVTEPASK